jgi:tight adherence protein C
MSVTIALTLLLGLGSLALLIFLVAGGGKDRLDARLDELAGKGGPAPERSPVAKFTRSALPRMGAPLVPKNEEERTKLQTRLMHAGLYGREALVVFLGVKMFLMASPALLGLAVSVLSQGAVPLLWGLVGGMTLGTVGMVGPSFWLDRRKKGRQVSFRRALPDALDVIVICLEGGISLAGAVRRVATELRTAHPLLAGELRIVQREVELGLSTGEALRRFADRCDLEEVRGLASVITQSERFGSSLVKALRVHAETLRVKRLQRAEELAQMASTKILIPTILFIFPGLFVVILAPAVYFILTTLQRFNTH